MGELKTKSEKASPASPWRENLEAVSMAIVVALLFKYFILEISKIPSGSMQPTLMGNPQTQVFDRVLVDKLSFHLRDPERFEIVVFKHPLERSRIMVKRLVGLPGEELKIEGGDLWTRPDSEAAWEPLRRPPSVQAEMWRPLDRKQPKRSSWKVVSQGESWRIDGRSIEARGEGRVRFRPDQDRITNGYRDGYPDALFDKIQHTSSASGRYPVGDLRVTGEIEARPGLDAFVLELTEGLRTYRFRLPGPSQAAEERASIQVRDSGSRQGRAADEPTEELSASPYRLPAGKDVAFAVENIDDRLALFVEGEELIALEIDAAASQEASVTLGLEGEGAELEDLQVYRDIYYLPLPHQRKSWQVRIPEGQYVMLGDNTQDSADSRDWKAKTFEGKGPPYDFKVRGNFRPNGENPAQGRSQEGESLLRFRDEWGEVRWFPPSEATPGLEYSVALVPRPLIQGRAVAVFWPIKPHRGLWRLAWLH